MKYRKKMEEFTSEMQEVHLKNVRELKSRENETLNRIKEKERILEQVAYEHRQKVLKDEEMLRFKEADLKKTTEMELLICKQERDKTAELAREYDRKISEMSELRVNLEKEMSEQLANYKTQYQRQFTDKDFEIHRRILAVEEDESRVKLQADRLKDAESRNATILNEVQELRKELDTLRKDNGSMSKENLDQKEQIRTLNANLQRENEIAKARESEARVFGQENRTLKKLMEESKEDYSAYKSDNNRLVQNLRLQMDETKEMIDRIRETKDREMARMREKFDDERRKEA